ncbi:hypothetical protein GCM10023115_21140 [Pontixanthobacter gangjinensis]|uniref:Uncharacterized protein n=1 Tax=Pontixanthobacter gangjinensis TaxID=1028742 RepID=A0A6I4SS73_9SPHN|nr:hypothetical protein [Pontixanthobacter gangjinensis]MXO57362.1 hypothetical protein [Pontixanthobacter gangjinensis]
MLKIALSNRHTRQITVGLVIIGLAMPQPAFSQNIDFGDDSSEYAKDGECDDLRFTGSGMTDTILLDEDVGHDATDCRVGFNQGRLTFAGQAAVTEGIALPIQDVDFGDNSSDFAGDGECDDVRFVGAGMAESLLTDSIGKDADDCKAAYENGRLEFNALFAVPTADSPIDYGDNSADFANDGECDDIRFTGDYSDEVIYLADSIGHDANDCRAAMQSGEARWQGNEIKPNFGMDI